MSENIKQINFSALKKNTENKKEELTNTSPPIKQNISEKKAENSNRIVTVSLGKKKKKVITKKVEKLSTEGFSPLNKEDKKNSNPLQETKVEKKVEEKIIIGDEILLIEPEKLFNNYKSDFNTKEDTIIERLKKLKNLPKTRPKISL
ncbi:MAG: hypothetical protein Q9M97_05380 [Candidatus Gracilibacteria bacterium]|nr:hypothetical protein [Candidatus Gracilibacteria bacterium]